MPNNLSKSKLVNASRSHDAVTQNKAVTHSTSLSCIVDMFFLAGASRNMSDEDIIAVWLGAYVEDSELAFKCLFWARDVRGGAGERRFFRVIWNHFQEHGLPQEVHDLEVLIPMYGRWDDVWANLTTLDLATALWFHRQLTEEKDGLLAKWLPRKGKIFSSMARHLKMKPKELRKLLVGLSSTVEQQMCSKKWDDIAYAGVPSVAMNRYRKAFLKNDADRFNAFIIDVKEGKEKISAGAIFPHEIVGKLNAPVKSDEVQAAIAQWDALPNYMEGSEERIIPVCDVSGSMTWAENPVPLDVCVALGLYVSERNEGTFKDAFITFSSSPVMEYLTGNLYERMQQLHKAHWSGSTNLQASLQLILASAIRDNISPDEMPTKILIMSDMEFNNCGYGTNLEEIKRQYAACEYPMPQIIFWNLAGRRGNSPAQFNDIGVALVSGFSPAILKNILAGTITTPEKFVLEVLNGERYEPVHHALPPAK